jgi:hypothetical protein
VQYDLYLPGQFSMALKQRFPRRFTFGPITFNDLDKTLDYAAARQLVIDQLEKTAAFAEPSANVCVHGYRVAVKERQLKRSTSLIKHARFL